MKYRFYSVLSMVFLLLASSISSSLAGSVIRLFYDGDSSASNPTSFRDSVSTLTNYAGFPNSPDFREQLDDFYALSGQPLLAGFQGKDNSGTDYGTWTRGYLEAPATGQYQFCLASAGNSELYLSPDTTPAKAALIASEPGTGETLFVGNRLDTRLSAPISLVQGQKYYFEVRHQHGGGTGYLQVGWQRPDGTQEIIPALHLAQYEIDPFLFTDYSGQAPVFNAAAPSNRGGFNSGNITNAVALLEGQELLLPLDVIAPQPTTFLWTTNGVPVPGQNLSYFDLLHTPATFNGVRVQAIISNAYGSLTSAVATVTVTPDAVPPTILSVDTAGDPNLLQVTYSKPVDPGAATNLANYQIKVVGGGTLSITNAHLSADQQTVSFSGGFNFQVGTSYLLTVQNIRDQAVAPNTLSPNPSTVPFVLGAPVGITYNFDAGAPSGFRFFGSAGVTNNPLANGGGLLRLTDARTSQNGAVVLTTRRNIDQVHLKFTTRIGDGGSQTGTSPPGDGFSLNISAELPLGTFPSPEYGYSPNVQETQFTVFFNAYPDSSINPVSIGVAINSQIVTNILAGTNGLPLNGVPPITSTEGHWAPVDINLLRDGTLNLAFDGVILLTNYPTAWVGIDNAEIGFAAATRGWYETHWIDDLYINFGEGDVGNAGLAANSVLGGTFPEGSQVKLVASPTGAGPFTYQWFENGSPLTGATNRILAFPATVGSGGSYSLSVSNAFSSFASTPQTVVIQPNVTPASVVSARGIAGGVNQVLLEFDQTLDPVTATSLSTYSSPYFLVTGITLGEDGRSVILDTTQQRVGIQYPLTIAGLKDNFAAHAVLNTNFTFGSTLTYVDEVLADNPVRYFKLDEASGTIAFTQTVSGDLQNTNGVYQNLPILGARSLVPSASSNEFAVQFVAANTNWVQIPNGGDLNDFRGPWSKKTYELWFNAASFPLGAQPGDSTLEAQTHSIRGLWEEGGNLRDIGLYVWNNTTNPNPAQALLTFHAYNSTADGPGSPFGLLQNPAVYVTYPVTTNVTYHVAAVLDGDATGTNGELRLYLNGQLVSRSTNGVGQIYNHNGDVEIGQGNGRSHLNVSGVWGAFDGVIDEVSVYDDVLPPERILAHYLAGTGASITATSPPTTVLGVDPLGNPHQLNLLFNQPVSPQTATNLANYSLKAGDGSLLPLQSVQLSSDLKTVSLNGSFSFAVGSSYNVGVQGVADILAATNTVTLTNLTFTFSSAGPVLISAASDLASRQVTENQSVQFSVVASGQGPFFYQWNYNGAPLPGATNATLAFDAPLNAGGTYTVTVSNQFSAITSSPATVLTVAPDQTPPELVSLQGLAGTLNQVVLTFNKPVDPIAATNLSTYSIPTSPTTSLTLLGASISSNGLEVVLDTSPQVHNQTNQITIKGLLDRSFTPNSLTLTTAWVSGISYRDEILSENGIVRYWTFDETNGTSFHTLVSKYDTAPENLVGTLLENPILGVPGLVPNVPNNTAIAFSSSSASNSAALPNAKDINAILGPWAKVTHIFSFKADTLPRANGTNAEAPAIYAHDRIAFYLYGTQDTNSPTEALLVFKAHNTSSDGPGAPWGGNTLATAKYVTCPIQPGLVYHVVGVVDGNASFSGELRLYVNGALVGTASGIGEIYKHPNTPPGFGWGYFTTHTGFGETINPSLTNATTVIDARLDGVIDEFALINDVLPQEKQRVAQLYQFAQTPPAGSPTLSSGTPSLTVSAGSNDSVVLTWPASATDFVLESTTDLASGVWTTNAVAPSTLKDQNTVTEPVVGTSRLFRLRHR